MELNQQLKYERVHRGWSQERVAREIGTDKKSIGRWERGEMTPTPYYREKLCTLFSKSAHELGFVKDERLGQQVELSSVRAVASTPWGVYDPAIPPLPNEGRDLVGRQVLLERMAEQLCTDKCIVLHGLPGVGKTALVVALLHHLSVRNMFHEGVLWAGLGPQPNNVLGKLSNWGKLLGLPVAEPAEENSLEARAIALRAGIGMRCMVLVVDDAWEIESALPFRVGGPNCAFLIVYIFWRSRGAIMKHWHWRVTIF